MKHKGSISDVIQERNRDLFRSYRKLLQEAEFVNPDKLFEDVVNTPAKRFWVSEERAAIVISEMMRGHKPHENSKYRNGMFREIYRRAMKLKHKHPELTIYEIACKVVNQKAPRFYITPSSARTIIFYEKKKWYEEKKKKLRFMFQ